MSFINCKKHEGVTDPVSYHTLECDRGDARLPMSPSSLKAFGQCPSRWFAGYQSPDSDAKAFGSLLDCRLLTPELFKARYSITPDTYPAEPKKKGELVENKPWNWNATFCKEWRELQLGKEIVSSKELAECDNAIKAMLKDEVIKSFLEASDKQVMLTGEWHDEATGLTIPVRCLLDLVPRLDTEFYKSLADLKSTRSAALQPFTRFCFQMGYHIQAAFDTDLYIAATKEDRCNWGFILQENYHPFQTGKRILSQDFIELGRAQYRKLLANYCWCLKNNKWPDYDQTDESVQGWSIVAPEPFMESQVMFAPKFSTNEETEHYPESADLIP